MRDDSPDDGSSASANADADADAGAIGYDARVSAMGEGPPLVYVPGMDGTGLLFYRQAPTLSRRFHVTSYRLRDEATTMETLVADLDAVVRMASPDGAPAVLVGESFGGALAMSYALAYPERVRALVVLNSFPYFSPQHRLQLAIAGTRLMPWGAMRVVRRLTAFRLHSAHTHRSEIRQFLRLTARTTRHGYVNRLRILRTYDVRKRLRALHVPTLYLAADEDHLIPSVAQAAIMAARAPAARMHVLAGHGHCSFLAPDVDLDAILREAFPTIG